MMDFFRDYDAFRDEAHQFEADSHVLVLGTFDAAQAHWTARLKEELPALEAAIKGATGEYAQHLVDEHTDELALYSERVRFSLNSATVNLVMLFVHTVRRMYRHLDILIPRQPGRYSGKHEVTRLRSEAVARFGLDETAWDQHIEFIEPLILARNLIIHNDGEADQELPTEQRIRSSARPSPTGLTTTEESPSPRPQSETPRNARSTPSNGWRQHSANASYK
jgi:hypothetical protein